MYKRTKKDQEEDTNLPENETTNSCENNSTCSAEDQDQECGCTDKTNDKKPELGEKLAELNDKYQRLYAEFENYRKRTSKEKMDLIKYSSEQIIVDLLPVVDDYERAITDMEKQNDIPDVSKEGIMLIYSKLMHILTQKGVKAIEAKGIQFDENLHEAISHFPADANTPKGTIVEEVQKGYYLHDKVIRFAKVVVAV